MLDFNTHCLHLLWLKWAHLHTLPTAPTELERSCMLCRWLPVPKCRYWYTYLIEVKTHCSLCRGVDHPGLPSCSTGSPMIRDLVFSGWANLSLVPYPIHSFPSPWSSTDNGTCTHSEICCEVAASESTLDILFIMQTTVSQSLHF